MMGFDLLLPLVTFCFVTSVTPGPNNLMLMASGANYGFRRTLPHMFGIAIGFTGMVLIVGIGLAGLFMTLPAFYTVMKVAAVAYMLWLAWKFAHAAPPGAEATSGAPTGGATTGGATTGGATTGGATKGGRPMTFAQAAAFQWVNPKAWAMAIGAVTAFAPDQSLAAILPVALVFGAVNLPTVSVWALMGQGMRRFLTNAARLRAFNWTMAGLLVASLWPVLRH
jgi:threonine/homoserine/homoserine lactone efflux protein